MKSISRFALAFALMALATLITPLRANAQSLVRGNFDMPFDAHWGIIHLQPGHYTLSIERTAGGSRLLMVRGPGGAQTRLLGEGSSIVPNSEKSYISFQKTGDTYAVKEFYCGAISTSYSFRVPKTYTLQADGSNKPEMTLIAVNASH
jgi:hypothetical protein